MTVKDLVKMLGEFPDDMPIYSPREDGDSIIHDEPMVVGLSFEHEGQEYNFVSIYPENADIYDEEVTNDDTEDSNSQA